MSIIEVKCIKCGQYYDSATGVCPQCGIVTAKDDTSPVNAGLSHSQNTGRCPMCGEAILSTAKKCKHCGEYLAHSSHTQTIEKTGKTWKAGQLVGGLIMIVALASCVSSQEGGGDLFVLGIIVWLGSRIGGWWYHG
jgi:hypothetical protein